MSGRLGLAVPGTVLSAASNFPSIKEIGILFPLPRIY
jgi:hypothetical protein